MKIKLYVGCALGGLNGLDKNDFLAKIVRLKNKLTSQGFEIVEFLGLGEHSPKEVYEHDILDCVENCDAMLAVCDYPSTGMGYEMATAIEKRGIPVLAVAHKDNFVSKIVLGISKPNFNFERYSDLESEVPLLVEKYLK